MRKVIFLFVSFLCLAINAQTQDPNILIGLNTADGVKIKANWPEHNGDWARGFYLVNQNNTQNFFGLGAYGKVKDGISNFEYGYIGKDWYAAFMTFLPNGCVGIGINNPVYKLQVEGTIYSHAMYSKRISTAIGSIEPTSSAGIFINSNYSGPGYNNSALIAGNAATGVMFGGDNATYSYGWMQGVQTDNGSIRHLAIQPLGGNVGIGTTNPYTKLSVFEDNRGFEFTPYVEGLNGSVLEVINRTDFSKRTDLNFFTANQSNIKFYTDKKERMTIMSNGSVGIGTTNPGNYKLAVEGIIGAREIKVTAENWADFVFAPNYRLRPLHEVEQFIKENNHLPEIPSEAKVKEEGIAVGEMNAKLLQKIEELTLYVIELKKENENLKSRVETLENK